jgi:hypothetical protein
MKIVTYMDTFSRFRTFATVNQLETIVHDYNQLASFEQAQLSKLDLPHVQ